MSKRNAILQPLGLALILAMGFGLVIGMIDGWIMSVMEQIFRRNEQSVYKELVVHSDGTPVYKFNAYPKKYQLLNGEPALSIKDLPELFGATLAGIAAQEAYSSSDINRIYTLPYNYSGSNSNWYFLHDGLINGKGYLVGYDKNTKRCIGYIGPGGMSREEPSQEQQFPVDGNKMKMDRRWMPIAIIDTREYGYNPPEQFPLDNVLMISGNRILKVDLKTGSNRSLIELPDLISGSLLSSAVSTDEKNTESLHELKRYLAVRSPSQVFILDSSGKKLETYNIPDGYKNKNFTFYRISGGQAIVQADPGFKTPGELTWIDASGKILRHEITDPPRPISNEPKYVSWLMSLVIPEPIVIGGVPFIVSGVQYYEIKLEGEASYFSLLAQMFQEILPSLVIVFIISAVLAWLCYRRQRRMALPWTWIWVIFVFIGGVPGFLAYRFHRRWPVLENCHVCGHAVPQDREKCAACGTEFPTPTPKGIEVFA